MYSTGLRIRLHGLRTQFKPFTYVYDAHTTIQSKGVMKRIDPATLNKGDLVVAEFNITCHHAPTAGGVSDQQQWFNSNWTTWYCQPRLSALYQLKEVSEGLQTRFESV